MVEELWHRERLRRSSEVMVVSMSALICLGLVMLYSVTAAQAVGGAGGWAALQKRLVWLLLGAVGLVIAWRADLGFLARQYRWALVVAVALLLLVFVPGLGVKINGARRWIRLGSQSLQPAEFAKWCLVVFVAGMAASLGRQLRDFRRGFLPASAAIGLVSALIIVEPDFGTAALMGVVGGVLLLVAGARWAHLAAVGGAGALCVALLVARSPERLTRVFAFLEPEKYSQGAAYQQMQSLIALGSGGMFGKGLGASGRKLFFLPEAPSDFIFAIIGEELGLIGALAVVALFAVFVFHGLRIATLARDSFRALVALGVTFAIGFQALINLAVVAGCAPTKGIALPFISLGGSSLVAMMIGTGLVLAVARAEIAAAKAQATMEPAMTGVLAEGVHHG